MNNIFDSYSKISELMEKSGRTIETATLKTTEELGEVASAIFGMKSYKNTTPEELQEEVVDLLQCAMGLYAMVQKEYPFDGCEIMDKKLKKWEDKYTKPINTDSNKFKYPQVKMSIWKNYNQHYVCGLLSKTFYEYIIIDKESNNTILKNVSLDTYLKWRNEHELEYKFVGTEYQKDKDIKKLITGSHIEVLTFYVTRISKE